MSKQSLILGCLLLFLSACAQRDPQYADIPEHHMRGSYKVGKPYQVKGIWYYPTADYAYEEEGIASWYGPGFHGKQTANGEVYDQHEITAAHKTLPLPCYVEVKNLENGKTIEARINDRGPYVNNRVIDLSKKTAQELGIHAKGTAKVRVKVLAEKSKRLAEAMQAGKKKGAVQVAETKSNDSFYASPRETVEIVSAPLSAPVSTPAPVQEVASSAPLLGTTYIQAGAFSKLQNAQKAKEILQQFGEVDITPIVTAQGEMHRVRLGPLADHQEAMDILKHVMAAGHKDAKIIN